MGSQPRLLGERSRCYLMVRTCGLRISLVRRTPALADNVVTGRQLCSSTSVHRQDRTFATSPAGRLGWRWRPCMDHGEDCRRAYGETTNRLTSARGIEIFAYPGAGKQYISTLTFCRIAVDGRHALATPIIPLLVCCIAASHVDQDIYGTTATRAAVKRASDAPRARNWNCICPIWQMRCRGSW